VLPLGSGTSGVGVARLALAILPHDEEHDQERREDGHGCQNDGHAPIVLLPSAPAIGRYCVPCDREVRLKGVRSGDASWTQQLAKQPEELDREVSAIHDRAERVNLAMSVLLRPRSASCTARAPMSSWADMLADPRPGHADEVQQRDPPVTEVFRTRATRARPVPHRAPGGETRDAAAGPARHPDSTDVAESSIMAARRCGVSQLRPIWFAPWQPGNDRPCSCGTGGSSQGTRGRGGVGASLLPSQPRRPFGRERIVPARPRAFIAAAESPRNVHRSLHARKSATRIIGREPWAGQARKIASTGAALAEIASPSSPARLPHRAFRSPSGHGVGRRCVQRLRTRVPGSGTPRTSPGCCARADTARA
jgi:hypothetical protein